MFMSPKITFKQVFWMFSDFWLCSLVSVEWKATEQCSVNPIPYGISNSDPGGPVKLTKLFQEKKFEDKKHSLHVFVTLVSDYWQICRVFV